MSNDLDLDMELPEINIDNDIKQNCLQETN